MYPPLQYTLEAHAGAATLYLHGTLLPHDAVAALRACFSLPAAVRRLRVDLRGVHAAAGACDTLAILLDEWAAKRRGPARVDLAPARRRAS
ncbi:MAG: hypothetical protein AVDCRST_MAG40-2883 [uncultured Gemmatimonadaceae bacterium]|uniref:STAS domain-containing protein n=1 Tax=uncultured Gemmatimonadaceae bacterium TaxID=246130 RepID=A0A6J4M5D7_9BACT|nr:MAG: hypothetical protein AVDCRST_MAG40-2883 [uncultured Gemmatimonadaceae bacterium]